MNVCIFVINKIKLHNNVIKENTLPGIQLVYISKNTVLGENTNLDGLENSDWLMAESLDEWGQPVGDWRSGLSCPAEMTKRKRKLHSQHEAIQKETFI